LARERAKGGRPARERREAKRLQQLEEKWAGQEEGREGRQWGKTAELWNELQAGEGEVRFPGRQRKSLIWICAQRLRIRLATQAFLDGGEEGSSQEEESDGEHRPEGDNPKSTDGDCLLLTGLGEACVATEEELVAGWVKLLRWRGGK